MNLKALKKSSFLKKYFDIRIVGHKNDESYKITYFMKGVI